MKIYTAQDLLKSVVKQVEAGYRQAGFSGAPVDYAAVSQSLVKSISSLVVTCETTRLECSDDWVKWAFINAVIENQLLLKQASIFYITIENPEDVIYRLVSSIMNIREDDLRMGNLSEKGWGRLTLAIRDLMNAQFCVINPLGSSFDWLMSVIKMTGEHRKGVVILDNVNKTHDKNGIGFNKHDPLSKCCLPLIITGQNPFLSESSKNDYQDNNQSSNQTAEASLKIDRILGYKEKVKLDFFHTRTGESLVLNLNLKNDSNKYEDPSAGVMCS